MANPTLENNTLARRKPIGEALGNKDTLLPTMPTVIHNATPPTLADGDVAPIQCDDAGSVNVTIPDPAVIASLQLAKGEYNATPPTLTDGQTDALQLTSDGDLKTEIQNPSIEQTTGAAHNTLNIAVAGIDTAGNIRPLKTDTGGELQVDVLSSALPSGAATAAKQLADNHQVQVSNFPATQPVSAASLPLPSGAATESTLTSVHEKINSLKVAIEAIRGCMGIASDLRVTLLSGTVTTVSSVTNIASIGSINANMQINALMNLAYLQSNHLNVTRS